MDLHLHHGWNASTYALALGTKVARIWHRIKEERFYQYMFSGMFYQDNFFKVWKDNGIPYDRDNSHI